MGTINKKINQKKKAFVNPAFTIVELLVVIVVIGILASITIVSYRGITQKATASTLQADLSNASKQIKLFQASDADGNYPTAINCTNPTPTELCIKPSGTNSFTNGYTVNNSSNPKTFTLTETNTNGTTYKITDKLASFIPVSGADWLTIGTQTWAKANLNVGTRIAGTSAQTINGGTNTVEKYCYGDTDAGCTNTDANGIVYGGLYQWDEAMKYVTTEGAQGICPTGSHIPTDAEWTTLETYLGSATAGTQLKPGGTSGLTMTLAGYRDTDGGSFYNLSWYADLWSSSESGTSAWNRNLNSGNATVNRNTNDKANGFSVRCVEN